MATNKYFKCPFCDKRRDRKSLVAHIESKHIDELPEGFTPLQATFHVANKKEFDYRPPCRICKSPTLWDEKKGRYNQLCGKQTCHDAYVEKMHRNMGDREGINRLTASPEGLEKMLAGRRISGKYKFQDGTYKTYTGSYELKALEFMDKILNCKSEDVFAPGPVMEYTLDGTKHYYITDLYYAPYNLIIEVKDGGDNPNNKSSISMDSSREKTIEKEPDNATYLDTYGWILHLLGKDHEAKAVFKHAMIYGAKDSATSLEHYAEVLEALGETDLSKVYRTQAANKKAEGKE